MKSVLSVLRRAVPLAVVGLLAGACNSVESASAPTAVREEDGGFSASGRPVNPASVTFRSRCSGLACTFSDTSNCTTDSTRLWSFGDGATASGKVGGKVEHTYPAGGAYVVTLSTATCGPATRLVTVD